MRKERYYSKVLEGQSCIGKYYIVMDGSEDTKIAECFYEEDASLIVEALNTMNRRNKKNG